MSGHRKAEVWWYVVKNVKTIWEVIWFSTLKSLRFDSISFVLQATLPTVWIQAHCELIEYNLMSWFFCYCTFFLGLQAKIYLKFVSQKFEWFWKEQTHFSWSQLLYRWVSFSCPSSFSLYPSTGIANPIALHWPFHHDPLSSFLCCVIPLHTAVELRQHRIKQV